MDTWAKAALTSLMSRWDCIL